MEGQYYCRDKPIKPVIATVFVNNPVEYFQYTNKLDEYLQAVGIDSELIDDITNTILHYFPDSFYEDDTWASILYDNINSIILHNFKDNILQIVVNHNMATGYLMLPICKEKDSRSDENVDLELSNKFMNILSGKIPSGMYSKTIGGLLTMTFFALSVVCLHKFK